MVTATPHDTVKYQQKKNKTTSKHKNYRKRDLHFRLSNKSPGFPRPQTNTRLASRSRSRAVRKRPWLADLSGFILINVEKGYEWEWITPQRQKSITCVSMYFWRKYTQNASFLLYSYPATLHTLACLQQWFNFTYPFIIIDLTC